MADPFISFLSFFFLSVLALHFFQLEANDSKECPPFMCGSGVPIKFPFYTGTPDKFTFYTGISECGLYPIRCTNNSIPKIKLEHQRPSYVVKIISYEAQQLVIQDDELLRLQNTQQLCNSLHNVTVPFTPFLSFEVVTPKFLFLDCKPGQNILPEDTHKLFNYTDCGNLYYYPNKSLPAVKHSCEVIEFPISESQVDPYGSKRDLSTLLAVGFAVGWSLTSECEECYKKKRGMCGLNETTGDFICFGEQGGSAARKKYIIGAAVGGGGCMFLFVCILFYCYRKKLYSLTSSKLLSRAISSNPSLISDLEKSNSLLGTHFFDYKELEEATNNFDPSKELGDGGFGIVYHGKLRDGRNVAVKRLYENNCRCVEQFKNEIKILSYLRHQNLVTLYGCSSRHSRELLLVYEFIPNGTVADHLHGDRAKPSGLAWHTRMSIAIETADALKYLHAVDIIHRDVKTNNILLDNNFRVKVADFGLSRLFPTDVTHVSTAPQGTPGYVDPDYHRCYQLTSKSDVYSFGVVLIELISSKPAVDITRHRHEINLANMAINKIINSALNELVDPTLRFESDHRVRAMITSVAGLAFRCLQDDKESRPPMDEVLESLRGIASEEYNVEKVEELNTPADDEVLLKKMPPLSPDAVTDAWESRTTTPNTSG